jgi:NAD(P)-dependent dehydrogenase (short-subunit alcohol dehydrogenase family)
MITKSLSLDLKPQGILAAVLHPGWVLTDMGGKNALINTTTSVEGMLKVMQGLNDDSSGAFISYNGDAIPF